LTRRSPGPWEHLGEYCVCTTTKNWPLQGSRFFGACPCLVHTYFLCDIRGAGRAEGTPLLLSSYIMQETGLRCAGWAIFVVVHIYAVPPSLRDLPPKPFAIHLVVVVDVVVVVAGFLLKRSDLNRSPIFRFSSKKFVTLPNTSHRHPGDMI
jgi:hypothetical protein